MMSILYSWKEGLTLLLPRNLKLFALVTLKSIIECYKVYFKYFWWIPVIALIHSLTQEYELFNIKIDIYNIKSSLETLKILDRSSYWFTGTINAFNSIVIWLTIRPSIDPKNYAYFRSMFFYYLPAFIVLILTSIALDTLPNLSRPLKIMVSLFFLGNYDLFIDFSIFFVTDTKNSLKGFFQSCRRAYLMLLYNLPLLVVTKLLLGIIFLPLIVAVIFIPFGYIKIYAMMFSPIAVCTFANIYIKRLYEQNNLYFKS